MGKGSFRTTLLAALPTVREEGASVPPALQAREAPRPAAGAEREGVWRWAGRVNLEAVSGHV